MKKMKGKTALISLSACLLLLFCVAKKTDIAVEKTAALQKSEENVVENTEKMQTKQIDGTPIDSSSVKEEDIVVTEAVKAEINEEGHLIVTCTDGNTDDKGYIGGENRDEEYIVCFLDYDGTPLKVELVKKGGNATPPPDPMHENVAFLAWEGNWTDVQSDTVVKATYTPSGLYYTVKFEDEDGTLLYTEKVAAGAYAKGPENPQKEDRLFAGWGRIPGPVAMDTTLRALYVGCDDPVIQISSASAQSGARDVAITVSLKNNPGICALRFKTEFTPGLTLSGYEFNSSMSDTSFGPQSMPANDAATFLWYLYDKDMAEDTVFVTLYFDVSDDVEGKQNIHIFYNAGDIFNFSGENVEFGVIDGAIEVKSA